MSNGIASCEVVIGRRDIETMCRFVRAIDGLGRLPDYRRHLQALGLPQAARFDPGYDSVMMGYDFHLSDAGPRLIEINNNAGGVFLALQAQYRSADVVDDPVYHRARDKLVRMFSDDYQVFSGDAAARPGLIAIVDERPQEQYNYPEMQLFAEVLEREWSVSAVVADPSDLDLDGNRVVYQGRQVDMIYNRHCDFYLETVEMADIREAYLQHRVCLSPNPWVYGLMGDKRRMMLWADRDMLLGFGMQPDDADFVSEAVPGIQLLADANRDEVWATRKQWVFKPTTLYGSRGVLPGTAMRKKRFEQLDPEQTIIQEFIPPPRTECAGADKPLKTDVRLFAYKDRVLGVAARVYEGQVTNFRGPGSGYARVVIGG